MPTVQNFCDSSGFFNALDMFVTGFYMKCISFYVHEAHEKHPVSDVSKVLCIMFMNCYITGNCK